MRADFAQSWNAFVKAAFKKLIPLISYANSRTVIYLVLKDPTLFSKSKSCAPLDYSDPHCVCGLIDIIAWFPIKITSTNFEQF